MIYPNLLKYKNNSSSYNNTNQDFVYFFLPKMRGKMGLCDLSSCTGSRSEMFELTFELRNIFFYINEYMHDII